MVDEAVARADLGGWALFCGTLDDVCDFAARAGWSTVPLRTGGPVVTDLRPRTIAAARPASMSAVVGMGAQPLHTDGAHLYRPPDVIALESVRPHDVGTRLWRASDDSALWEDLHHGVFVVSNGVTRRHCHAADGDRIRFDPCCMSPADERARRVVAKVAAAVENSAVHRWRADASEVLIIDNRKTLHARDAGAAQSASRHLRRIAFSYEGANP